MTMIDARNARVRLREAAESLLPYPGSFVERGIVICGGGVKYFPPAWVCCTMLRRLGCDLPIELWYLGPQELNDGMRRLLDPLRVKCVDALEVRQQHPARLLNGWEVKPFAMLHSPFEEVLLLDADNVPVVDPAFLFEEPEYQRLGSIFWPDRGRLESGRSIWELTGVPYRDEPEFETGQAVVHKRRCWNELSLTMWMNEHSDFWYRHVHGDKETFHFAWRTLGTSYAMAGPLFELPDVLCQHDFSGRRIFQHRGQAKWSLRSNPRITGFLLENECINALQDLGERWSPSDLLSGGLSPEDREDMARAAAVSYRYVRVGHDERPMTFSSDGHILEGGAGCEAFWWIRRGDMFIAGKDGTLTMRFHPGIQERTWNGRWLIHECMPVELQLLD